jgi:serine/threonine-protein kinase
MISDDPTVPVEGLPTTNLPTLLRGSSDPLPRAAGAFAPGTIIATRYRIVALLGKGGMGAVYRADDLRLAQPVALKFVALGEGLTLEHLYHEVRVARQVSHPNVCRVHDVVESDGLRFIAMEYVDGEDLASLLRRIGRLPVAKAIEVGRDIAAGLAAAHERGIIHRDLKPANVMIDGAGRAHVTDFGLAALAGAHDHRIAGTPAYMAPEQVAGEPVTTRTDVYAFGLLLHELLTGERVYGIVSHGDRQKQLALTPRPVSASVSDVDPAVDELIARCLSADPSLRPATAREVLAMLPGGDPLDAAVAAGETPSPEMIAAAAETGELSLRVAAAMFVFIIIGILLAAWQSESYLFTLMEKPPPVMRERAEEIVALAGERSAVRDETYFFTYDAALRNAVLRDEIDPVRPGVMRFVHRRSPVRMAPREVLQAANEVYIFVPGRVTMTDPALDVPGSATVILDQHRALVEYRALPSSQSSALDWRPLLQATGIDMRTLTRIVPKATSPVASDARIAWNATFPGRDDRITIEAASLRGMPAWLRVAGPWGVGVAAPQRMQPGRVMGAVQFVIIVICTIVAVIVTRNSLRRGRLDRRGAARVALYLGSAIFLAVVLSAHHAIAVEEEARLLSTGFGAATAAAVLVWCVYIALEPDVRRTWPRALIGWTRLLAGRFRDPMVGRELLFGIGAGVIGYQFYWLGALQSGRSFVKSATITPLPVFIGDSLLSHVQAVQLAIGTMLLCLLLRKLVSGIGMVVVLGVLFGLYSLVVPASGVFVIVMTFAIIRFGLLIGVSMGATFSLLANSPLTLDPRAWYWPRSLAILCLIGVSAAWAARRAIGRNLTS